MFSFKAKSRSPNLSALVETENGVATATVRRNRHAKPVLEQCAFQSLAPGQEMSDLYRQAVATSGMDKHHCTTLLPASDYQLLMVEAPEVPPAELKAAIRWRIRDLIDFHIDDAVLDVFDTPPSGARGVQEHLYAVVSKSSLVRERVDLLLDVGIELEIIDIPELALRNIAAQLEQDSSGQALLYFSERQGLITLTRDATLYLARSMDIGYADLQRMPDLVDRLALELQRSMDYYDRHFQQAPIGSVTLCPLPEPLPLLAGQLSQQIGVTVNELAVGDLVETTLELDDATLARSLLAIGAALRSEPSQL